MKLRDMESVKPKMSVRDVLTALRWSVKKAESLTLAPGLTIRMLRNHDLGSPSGLVLEVRFRWRDQVRVLGKEHIETRGKSEWLTNNTWRLSPQGVEFFAPGLEAVVAKIASEV